MNKEQIITYVDDLREEIPFIISGTKKSLTLNVRDCFGSNKKQKVNIYDVLKYYAYEAGNLLSGMRTLAGIAGDWRNVDNLANICLSYFKQVNPESLKSECKKSFSEVMSPNF
jgi:hypothetical protein